MAGQLGNESCVTENLIVYKIDYVRSLIFLKGGIPGGTNGLVEIHDAKKKRSQYKSLHYPTFIPEKGKTYENVVTWEGMQDLNEKFAHDNDEVLGASEEEEEGPAEPEGEEDITLKK